MSRLYVGTSGYAYAEWKGSFYPEKLAQAKMLSYYAERLDAVEINYTFRQFPSEKSIAAWVAQTPEHFKITLKAHQKITHYKRLRGIEDDVDLLLSRRKLLGERAGPVLFQIPPTLQASSELLGGLVHSLPAGTRAAFEVRHPSWHAPETYAGLRAANIALVMAETDEQDVAGYPVTADFVYLRLRRGDYTQAQLAAWAARAADWVGQGKDVFCYFKHEDNPRAPEQAVAFRASAGA